MVLAMKYGRGLGGAAPEFDAAWCGVRCSMQLLTRQCHVWVVLFIYLFLASIHAKLGRFCQNRAVSIELGRIGQWPKRTQNDRNRLKSALNHVRTNAIGFEWGANILNLSFLNFIMNICCFFCVLFCVSCIFLSLFCESRHSHVFFKNILIVKIYRKYK